MDKTTDNNKMLFDENEFETYVYNYNFLSMPWHDRTRRSKIGIISLLIFVFITIMVCVLYNFCLHYKSYHTRPIDFTPRCHLVRMEDHRYVAGIYTLHSPELLCVGAMVTENTVLASGICIKSGPIRIRFRSLSNLQCNRGFTVDVIEPILHQGDISHKLVLLSSYDGMQNCGVPISLGRDIDLTSKAIVYGRPLNTDKFFSRQTVTIERTNNCTFVPKIKDKLDKNSTICVYSQVRCPIRAGDLLVQNNKLFGLASTTIHKREQNNIGYFADLRKVHQELKDFEVDVTVAPNI